MSNLLTTEQAAKVLSISAASLIRDRFIAKQAGTPPHVPFVRVTERTVRYRAEDLEAHISANLVG